MHVHAWMNLDFPDWHGSNSQVLRVKNKCYHLYGMLSLARWRLSVSDTFKFRITRKKTQYTYIMFSYTCFSCVSIANSSMEC